mmetsp:Transcript_26307/g.47147  ORF Transcript_26307/g.47147 Transcript_26307/m.47147 type:complete len:180 (-) Transcript_26307:2026-2565(-)
MGGKILRLVLTDFVSTKQLSLALCVPFLYQSKDDWQNAFRIMVFSLSFCSLVITSVAFCREKLWLFQTVSCIQASLASAFSTALLSVTLVLGIATATTLVGSGVVEGYGSIDCTVRSTQTDSDVEVWAASCYLFGLCLSIKFTTYFAIDSFYQSLEFTYDVPRCEYYKPNSEVVTDDNK